MDKKPRPKQRTYLCIDLKSFYASVECVERGLNPMTTNLVVADPSRSEKTICLAVSPSMKERGVRNRCRVYEIPKNIKYIMAPPRMKKYINYAARVYGIYLQYISKEDIHVYSVDEAFLDVTDYLKLYKKTPREMAAFLTEQIQKKIGINATAGIGPNLYLAKIALDIIAKHSPNFIGELTEETYQKRLWDHRPISDFWRIGSGIQRVLEKHRMFTMGDIAHADEEILYRLFGIDAELIIDHAWGREPVTIADIKKYRSKDVSFSSGQVLPRDYTATETALIVREMTREMCLRLAKNQQLATSITLSIGLAGVPTPDEENIGLQIIYHNSFLRGTHRFLSPTNSTRVMVTGAERLLDRIVDQDKKYRRVYLDCNKVIPASTLRQAALFEEETQAPSDKKIQTAIIDIKSRFGKNAIFRGEDLEEAATTRARNQQIGGHKSE